jgi:signal transduction histidine kinase
MLFVARAPGWERARLMGGLALTAGLYSAIDVWFYLSTDIALRGTLVQANLTVAALHAAIWVWFTFSDGTNSLRSIPVWARVLAFATLTTSTIGLAADALVDRSRVLQVDVAWLGISERVPPFSALGNGVALLVVCVLGVSMAQHVRRMRRGEAGAAGIVLGFAIYGFCIVEEALVAAGVLQFMYLASPGYVFLVLPLTVQLLKRLGDDTRKLDRLTRQLSTEVQARTTERDEARGSLMEQQRLAALGRLAAGVGHEINNPLQYLLFSLEELRTHTRNNHAASAAVEQALEGADRIRGVVESLRRYGVVNEVFAPVDLRDVVQTALRIASPQLRHEGTIVTELGETPLVLGDEGKLVQLLVNPLVNAIQTLAQCSDPTHGRVYVSTRRNEHGDAEISIRDNGPGFSDDLLPRLGEPYVTSRAQSGGTGLGLFVTQGLVSAHGGTLTLANAPEGGAVVRITLPAAPAAALVAKVQPGVAPGAPASKSRRILVVDDEPSLLAVLERGLTRLGHQVTTARDGADALRLVNVHEFDAIVSDLMMPNITGMALADAIAHQHPWLRERMVIMTGGAVTPEDAQFLARSDIVVVEKPVRLAQLALTIDALPG